MPSSYRMNRPSPSDSATLFRIGTVRRGNDGNMWMIASNVKGIHRWVPHGVVKRKQRRSTRKSIRIRAKSRK